MAYYVVDHQGNKYGPADIDTLNQWIADGRLVPHMMLEDERSGGQIVASSVAGLNFGMAAPPPPASNYPRAGFQNPPSYSNPMSGSSDSNRDAIIGIACAVGSPVLLFTFGIGGLILAGMALRFGARANSAGNKLGLVPMVLGVVMIGLWAVVKAHLFR